MIGTKESPRRPKKILGPKNRITEEIKARKIFSLRN